MSGRGRGRGGRGGRGGITSQARLLLQKSAAEAGVDERSAISLTRPALYPDMLWHSSGHPMTPEEEAKFKIAQANKTLNASSLNFVKRTPAMTFLVKKNRQLLEHFQSSPQFIQHVPPHMDIARYRDTGNRTRTSDRPDRAVRDALGKLANTDYLPEELLDTANSSRRKSRKRRRNEDGTLVDLDEFEAKERGGEADEGDSSDNDSDEEDDGLLENPLEEEEEEDDNQDYTTNYYESEDESDGGGDGGEPTF